MGDGYDIFNDEIKNLNEKIEELEKENSELVDKVEKLEDEIDNKNYIKSQLEDILWKWD